MNSRSVAQSSSSFPAVIFARHIAGVQPHVGSRGLVRLAPSLVVPSVQTRAYGIDIEWDRSRDRWDLTAQFPGPAAVKLVLPFPREHLRSLAINGTIIKAPDAVVRIDPHPRLQVVASLETLF